MNPRFLLLFVVVTLAVLLSGCGGGPTVVLHKTGTNLNAPETGPLGDKPILAIPIFRRAEDPLEPDYARLVRDAASALTAAAQDRLARSEKMTLVARQDIQRIMAEHEFQTSLLVDPAQRKKLGQLLAADYLLLGTANEFVVKPERVGAGRTLVSVARVSFRLSLVAVESGRVVWSVSHAGDGRRMLSHEEAEFEIDPIRRTILENKRGDAARMSDLRALGNFLMDEATAPLR